MSTLVLTFPNIRTNAKLQESCLLSSHSYHTGLSSGTGTFNRCSSQRAEFLLGLRPGPDAVASPFAARGLYGRRTGVIVAGGHTVPSDGPLWPGLEMIAFQVRDQVAVIPKVQLWDGSHVHFFKLSRCTNPSWCHIEGHGHMLSQRRDKETAPSARKPIPNRTLSIWSKETRLRPRRGVQFSTGVPRSAPRTSIRSCQTNQLVALSAYSLTMAIYGHFGRTARPSIRPDTPWSRRTSDSLRSSPAGFELGMTPGKRKNCM